MLSLLLVAQIATADYATRRAEAVAEVDSGVVVAFGAPEPLDYWPTFYQRPSFEYLTGFDESDAVLVMVVRHRQPTATLFVPTRTPVQERWVGARTRVADMQQRFGVAGRDIAGLPSAIDSLAAAGLPFYVVQDAQTTENADRDTLTAGWQWLARLRTQHPYLVVHSLDQRVRLLRARKSPAEVAVLREAARISGMAHREAMRSAAPGCGEWEIQALLEGTFRRLGGNRPGYGSIVGSGPNATILHYMEDSRVMQDGELLLVDAATAFQGYSADVTRTYPVNGRFTPAQRELYQIVRDAQEAFVRQIKPGVAYGMASDSGQAVVSSGLAKLGLIESADATFDPPDGMTCPAGGCSQVRLYALHGYGGHGIGLEVHDPAQYYGGEHRFETGDVFTVEPGLYVSPELLGSLPDTPKNQAMLKKIRPAAEKYRGMGVRIEDDYALSAKGLDWLSSEAPREIGEIEKLMREKEPEMPGGGKCGGVGKEAQR
ncbi:MAG TPA: Xaa-Pro aminopeptidase [Gemmatimonadales bacterium]|nr:Xaa-Pro aminopeptidase [Gemmatimonadales bacterium]